MGGLLQAIREALENLLLKVSTQRDHVSKGALKIGGKVDPFFTQIERIEAPAPNLWIPKWTQK